VGEQALDGGRLGIMATSPALVQPAREPDYPFRTLPHALKRVSPRLVDFLKPSVEKHHLARAEKPSNLGRCFWVVCGLW
jgi:hypothetical protein